MHWHLYYVGGEFLELCSYLDRCFLCWYAANVPEGTFGENCDETLMVEGKALYPGRPATF